MRRGLSSAAVWFRFDVNNGIIQDQIFIPITVRQPQREISITKRIDISADEVIGSTTEWRSLVSPVIDQAFLIYTTSRVKEGKTEEQTKDRFADQWAKNKKEIIKL